MSTYTQILYHLVFGTKDRTPVLAHDERGPQLFRDIWGSSRTATGCIASMGFTF